MKKWLLSFVVIILLRPVSSAQSYGLYFNSHEEVLEKRTSLDLSPDESLCFNAGFGLSFEINFVPNRSIYFGYIVRIIDANGQNIDLIYNQRSSHFEIITGETFSGISFNIDSLQLHRGWNKFGFRVDVATKTLAFSIDGQPRGTCKIPNSSNCFKILWGANDYQKFKTRDVPPFQLRDIRLFEGQKLKYHWPLDEESGTTCYDRIDRKHAKVKNAVWIKPKHQQWQLLSSFSLRGNASVAYNPKTDRLFISGSDSTGVISFRAESNSVTWHTLSKPVNLLLGSLAVYDTLRNSLYNFFIDQRRIASYDLQNNKWDNDFTFLQATEFLHPNKFISPVDTCLYIIGGYGQMRYKNRVQRYHLINRTWDTVAVTGDYFPPRYLAGLGNDPGGTMAYIIGGYGSMNGDQLLNPRTYYDLFTYDVKKRAFKKICDFRSHQQPFTFANSLVVGPGNDELYGLVFSDDSFNSKLQLVRISPKDSSIEAAASPFPYAFHDVESFADLFYSPAANKLIAVTLLFSKETSIEKETQVKIYTLDFPPQAADTVPIIAKQKSNTGVVLAVIAGALAILLGIYFVVRRRSRSRKAAPSAIVPPVGATEAEAPVPVAAHDAEPEVAAEEPPRSAIYLFGNFQVFDKEGKDIASQFAPLLKELFLVMFIHTLEEEVAGISSEKLNDILWYDKPIKDAKNNRSVNITKLRTILGLVGESTIQKKSGYWQLVLENDIYADYIDYLGLVKQPIQSKEQMQSLLRIIKRGAFLAQTEYDWLDDIKSRVSYQVIDICLGYIKKQDIPKDPEFIIQVAQSIFHFDQLNEEALVYKCRALILLKRHALANTTYQNFVKYYKDIYGEEFGKSFHDIVS